MAARALARSTIERREALRSLSGVFGDANIFFMGRSDPKAKHGEPSTYERRGARSFSLGELESSLTDVRAEMCLVEAERKKAARELASDEVQDDVAERDRLSRRRRSLEGRLEELEARTAGLRARLEQVVAAENVPRNASAKSRPNPGGGSEPTR